MCRSCDSSKVFGKWYILGRGGGGWGGSQRKCPIMKHRITGKKNLTSHELIIIIRYHTELANNSKHTIITRKY